MKGHDQERGKLKTVRKADAVLESASSPENNRRDKGPVIKCKKCGRDTYKAEVEEFTMRNICKGCELVETACRCRPLNIRPLFGDLK